MIPSVPDPQPAFFFVPNSVDAKVLSTETAGYQRAFAARRSVSTMAEVARLRLCALAIELAAAAASEGRKFRILSVGCGDGELDLAVLEKVVEVAQVEYLGLEVNSNSVEMFEAAIETRHTTLNGKLNFRIHPRSAEHLPDVGDGFDLVLMSHVLYYFDDPVPLVRRYLHEACRIDGRVVIVHSGLGGIPALMADVPDLPPFLCAESIRDSLANSGLRVQFEMLESELEVSEILLQSPIGKQILGFCIERDVAELPEVTYKRLLKALWSRCQIKNDGTWLCEPLAFLTLHNDLGVGTSRSRTASDSACDPIEDYHQLALSFNWLAKLAAKKATSLRVLDVGCGSGRWLKVLRHHWPELTKLRHSIAYSAIDSSADVMTVARSRSEDWSQWERGWASKIELVDDLPTDYYDVVWSMHSLYAVSVRDLGKVLTKIVGSLKRDGLAIIAMPNRESFYITAAPNLADQEPFTSAEDVCDALRSLRLVYEVREIDYEEHIDVADEASLRRYVWEESIGNSYSVATDGRKNLPSTPTASWFEAHRREDVFCFPQRIRVITIRGDQSLTVARAQLIPDVSQMTSWTSLATEMGIAEHAGLSSAPVIEQLGDSLPPSWIHGGNNTAANDRIARELFTRVTSEPLPEWGSNDLGALLRDELAPLLRHGTRDNAPGYMGYIPTGGLYLGAIAEYLGAAFNRYSAMFMASPGAAAIEALVISWLNEITGIRASAEKLGLEPGGLLVSGSSIATVTAVHAARARAVSQGKDAANLVAYFGQTAHCCVTQALATCGIRYQRCVPTAADHRVDMAQLSGMIADDRALGLEPFLIALSAGEVATGAIDDFECGRAIANEANAWLHIDGAYGAFFVLARSAPVSLHHISLADSLCLDPHKGLGLPYGTGVLLTKDVNDLRRAFGNDAAYLPAPAPLSRPPDMMDLGMEMTRPFRGLRLWLPIKLLGVAPFRDHLEQMLHLARQLGDELTKIPGLELIRLPELSICTFRLRLPATESDNRRLLDLINSDGRFFLTGCTTSVSGGSFALRVALLSFRTDEHTVAALVERIHDSVQRVVEI